MATHSVNPSWTYAKGICALAPEDGDCENMGPLTEEACIMSEAIYSRAVRELFQHTYGRLEDRDRIKVVQLFDKLLKESHSIHVDDLRRLCKDTGYADWMADDIGQLYDTLCLIRHELEDPRTIDCWPIKIMDGILGRCEEVESRDER
jgi:hypothetical protein